MKTRENCRLSLLVAVVCAPFVAGCGQGDRPPLGAVHGTVTLDGRPLAGATVTFHPVEPGRASTAITDADGRYELIYIRQDKGAKVGFHLVRITPANRKQENSKLASQPYGTGGQLKVEVKRGDNVIDFPLASK